MKIQSCKFFFVLFIAASAALVCAESDSIFGEKTLTPTTTFAKRIKGTGDLISTIQTSDGSYVSLSKVTGTSFLVRKVSSSGRRVWERILRLELSGTSSLHAITQTTDGGYVLAGENFTCTYGYFYCYNSDQTGILMKLHANGTLAWKRKSVRMRPRLLLRL